jgi:hypothetical protein
MLHREEIEDVGGAMPPSKPLREDWIEIFERWVLAGMPETPDDLPAPVSTDTADADAAAESNDAELRVDPTSTP